VPRLVSLERLRVPRRDVLDEHGPDDQRHYLCRSRARCSSPADAAACAARPTRSEDLKTARPCLGARRRPGAVPMVSDVDVAGCARGRRASAACWGDNVRSVSAAVARAAGRLMARQSPRDAAVPACLALVAGFAAALGRRFSGAGMRSRRRRAVARAAAGRSGLTSRERQAVGDGARRRCRADHGPGWRVHEGVTTLRFHTTAARRS
jgi:hypothetical protein